MKNMFSKNGKHPKVVVVTGASAGVGRATVREFAKKGFKIALLARGLDGLNATKKEVEELGGEALIIPTDVADFYQIEHAAQLTEETFGPIDIWVNNAMTSVFSPVSEMLPEEFKRVTEVTYLGQVYGAQVALKRMKPRNKGIIIFVGSALAYRGIPLQSAYCGSKHAIQGFFDSLRTELLHDKSDVQITMIQLPAMNTPQFGWVKSRLPNKARPMGKIYEPEVAARAILFATENVRREMFVGATTVQAIVGNKIVPEVGDYYLSKKGFQGQQTDQPEDPNRANNLWEPVPGDAGVHGTFEEEANKNSKELWVSMHKPLVATAGMFAMLATGLLLSNKSRNEHKEEADFQKQLMEAETVIVVTE